MRGSGSDAYVNYSDDPDDGEGNRTWNIVPGSSTTAHPDTCDSYGNEWMYSDGIRGAGNILEKIGIDPSFVSRWRVCDPDTLDIGTYGFYPPYNSGGSYANIFCQDNVVIGERHVMVTPICSDGEILTYDQYNSYVDELKRIYNTTDSALSYDERMRIVKAVDYRDLLVSWSGNYPEDVFYKVWNYVLDNVAPASSLGAISLKLRAEKPNPYFNPNLPEGNEVISTKAEAASAMIRLFTTSNTNLLARPKVGNATMRAAGWDAPGNGYATVMSVGYGVEYGDGVVHEILWTPIKPEALY